VSSNGTNELLLSVCCLRYGVNNILPFCQTGDDGGFESTSHFSDTGMPSLIGMPNPGIRLIPNEGVSIMGHKRGGSRHVA